MRNPTVTERRKKVLNELNMEKRSAPGFIRPWQDAVGEFHCRVQPPDAENRMSGGVGGSRCAIAVTRPDLRRANLP